MTDDRSTLGAVEVVAERVKQKGSKVKIELQALSYVMMNPADLQPNPYNPNRQDEDEFALLRLSIQKDGFTLPIVANKDNVIIDGEHRWRAALAEGLKSIPVVKLDLDDQRMKLSTIRHNKARGTHDVNLEALIFADLEKLMGRDFIVSELALDAGALDEILSFTSAPMDLAGEEYGDSWVPVKNDSIYDQNADGKPEDRPVFSIRRTVDSAIVMRSPTPQANLLSFKKVAQNDSEAGREKLYTLTAILNPEDGEQVRVFLERTDLQGDTPAERLYWFLLDLVTQKEGSNV